jgi:hypothetical protein
MTEHIETGFEEVVAPAAPSKIHPAAISKEEAAARTATEIAEGKRQGELHKNDPVVPHPSQLSDPDAAMVQLREKAQAQESEAARMNRELFDRILAARNQPPAPPPRPQPVAPAISEQTKREMAAGREISARHAAQQSNVVRRPPNAREIAAQGSTTPVFTPGDVGPSDSRPFGVSQGYKVVG